MAVEHHLNIKSPCKKFDLLALFLFSVTLYRLLQFFFRVVQYHIHQIQVVPSIIDTIVLNAAN